MIWYQEEKIFRVIEFSPLVININRKVNEKLQQYGPLVCNSQMYPQYKFQVAPFVIGAIGYVLKGLINYLKIIGFNKHESKALISNVEIESILGTVKIAKRF